MPTNTKKLAIRLIVALSFAMGVAAMVLWVVPYYRRATSPSSLKVADTPKQDETSLPDGWKRLEVRNKVSLIVPQDMKATEPLGDSLRYREAYSNRDIYITIVYDLLVPEVRDESLRRRVYSCDTSLPLLENPTYHESVIEIHGRKAKLGIDRSYQPKLITADLCFAIADDLTVPLRVVANCKNDRALVTAQEIFRSITFKTDRPL